MSSSQRPPRRLSARIQEKDPENAQHPPGKPAAAQQPPENGKKRKNGEAELTHYPSMRLTAPKAYDEEDDGFLFTRVKKNKQKDSRPAAVPPPPQPQQKAPLQPRPANIDTVSRDAPPTEDGAPRPVKKKPPKMSFSTPKPLPKDDQPLRRSKRLSSEQDDQHASPKPKTRRKDDNAQPLAPQPTSKLPHRDKSETTEPVPPADEQTGSGPNHEATKIALPFADTPVIKRNKEMREGKKGKGERRSSLSLRGRRASSLIETGNSNALPHNEVEIADFYKHIESDGLPEPRRMRQLLTWCATRCLDQKSRGAEFEDSSAIAAARVIEEELLKDLSNKSELSDWFSREDVAEVPKELPVRPNPKNAQNAEKIKELEEQIQRFVLIIPIMYFPDKHRLRSEKDSLEALLRPPFIPEVPPQSLANLDRSLFNEAERGLLESLASGNQIQSDTSKRLNAIQTSLGPTIDTFADGLHKIAQYRNSADNVASNVLRVCATKLDERERERRRQALGSDDRSPGRDLDSVLRGLSRADR
jgi:kinetochore protein Mis13/DSN1